LFPPLPLELPTTTEGHPTRINLISLVRLNRALRSSVSDEDFVDIVADDLPVVFRFNQALDVLEEATPCFVIEAIHQGIGV
jgi:hypothetical protein